MTDYKIKYTIVDASEKEHFDAREGFIYQFNIESLDYYKCKEILSWCKDTFPEERFKSIGGSSSDHTNIRTYFEIITLKDADDTLLFRLRW